MKVSRELLAIVFVFCVGATYEYLAASQVNALDVFASSLTTICALWIGGWLKL